MSPQGIRLGLVLLLTLSVAAVPVLLTRPMSVMHEPSPALNSPMDSARISPSPDSMNSLIGSLIARTPFRARRTPAAAAYEPDRRGEMGNPRPPSPPKPALVLTGIVWDQEPAAIVEGLPGIDGPRVLRRRDVVGALRVQRISREQVIISGLDTTWKLQVREPWK